MPLGVIKFDPTTGINLSRILDGESTAATQNPTGLGPAAAVQIEFGPAVNSGADPVSLSAAGVITIHTAGTYRIKVSFQFSRVGNSGVSELLFRVTDGAGNQLGRSIAAFINSANDQVYIENDTWLTVPAGLELKFELMRDVGGDDSGGLATYTPTVVAGSWSLAPAAAIRVERWIA